MLKIKEAIIVEGKYDVNKLKQIVDTVIIETGGFAVFNDKDRLNLIRKIAKKRGILIFTDSDGAGLIIRNYLKSSIPKEQIKNAYIPQIAGKEKRKKTVSKEGVLGVEGVSNDIIIKAIYGSGAIIDKEDDTMPKTKFLTKADFFELGLSGVPGSEKMRKKVLKLLDLPLYLSTNALLEFINVVIDYDDFFDLLEKID